MSDFTVVPAQLDFFIVTAYKHPRTGRVVLRHEPIVAWCVEDQAAKPVIASGRLPSRYGVQFPDGRTMVGNRIIWSTEDEPETEAILDALAAKTAHLKTV